MERRAEGIALYHGFVGEGDGRDTFAVSIGGRHLVPFEGPAAEIDQTVGFGFCHERPGVANIYHRASPFEFVTYLGVGRRGAEHSGIAGSVGCLTLGGGGDDDRIGGPAVHPHLRGAGGGDIDRFGSGLRGG